MEVTKLEWGLIEFDRSQVQDLRENESPDRVVEVEKVRLVSATIQIPARLGISFGIIYYLDHWNMCMDVPLRCCIYHPPLQPPNQPGVRTHVNFDFSGETDAQDFSFFTFEYPWEVAVGRWVFRVFYRDQKLVEQAFEVY